MTHPQTDRIPLRRIAAADGLDDTELLQGYFDGHDGEPEPGNNRSFSYWHGWRNGAVDGGHREKDDAQAELARDAVANGWFNRRVVK